jgi:hypothetical protein
MSIVVRSQWHLIQMIQIPAYNTKRYPYTSQSNHPPSQLCVATNEKKNKFSKRFNNPREISTHMLPMIKRIQPCSESISTDQRAPVK